MRVLVFGTEDLEARLKYEALFEACPQACIQQSTYWAEAIRQIGPDEPLFLMACEGDDAIAGLPLYYYDGPAGGILTSVPQAGPLGGIFVRPASRREDAYAALLEEALRIARARRCLTLTIMSSPFEDDHDLYERFLAPDFSYQSFTQVVPLAKAVRGTEWVLPDNAERNPGRTIRKARAAGLTARLAESAEEFRRWYRIHERRHRELSLTPLPYSLLDRLRGALFPRQRAFLQIVMAGDDVAAGCLFVHHRDICDAFIMSMNSDFAPSAPNYLLVERALFTMAARGVRIMNWQSSPRRGHGVYSFKRQWGSEERPYYFLTKLFCNRRDLMALGAEGVRAGYPGHFVAPFDGFKCDFSRRNYRKP